VHMTVASETRRAGSGRSKGRVSGVAEHFDARTGSTSGILSADRPPDAERPGLRKGIRDVPDCIAVTSVNGW